MADETIIKLTDEQKRQMKAATGQEHDELKVQTVGSKLSPRVAPRRAKLTAKKLGKGMKQKVAAKRPPLSAKVAPKRVAKKGGLATRVAAKRTLKKHIAPKM